MKALYIVFPKGNTTYNVSPLQQTDGNMAIVLELPDEADVSMEKSNINSLGHDNLTYLLKKLDSMFDEDEKTPLIKTQQEWIFVMKVLAERGIVDGMKFTEFHEILVSAKVRSKTLASVDSLSRNMKKFSKRCHHYPNWNDTTFGASLYYKGLRIAGQCMAELNKS